MAVVPHNTNSSGTIQLNVIPQKEVVNVSCSSWYNEQGTTGDDNLRTWTFVLYNGYYLLGRSGFTKAYLVCNNQTFPATYDGMSMVVVTVPKDISSTPGHYDGKILLTNDEGDEKLYSAAFTIWVEGL
jgi:hypothetical protein